MYYTNDRFQQLLLERPNFASKYQAPTVAIPQILHEKIMLKTASKQFAQL